MAFQKLLDLKLRSNRHSGTGDMELKGLLKEACRRCLLPASEREGPLKYLAGAIRRASLEYGIDPPFEFGMWGHGDTLWYYDP